MFKYISIDIYERLCIPVDDSMPFQNLVFPKKRVSFSPTEKFSLAASVIVGLLAIVYEVFFSGEQSVLSRELVVFSLIAFAAQAVYSFHSSLSRYSTLVHEALYHKSIENDQGLLSVLADQAQEQVFLSCLITYFVLRTKNHMSKKSLQEKYEAFLKTELKTQVIFPGSLLKNQLFQSLVEKASADKLSAKSMLRTGILSSAL